MTIIERQLPEKYKDLRFIGPDFNPRDCVDNGLDSLLSHLADIHVEGAHNIPHFGPLIIGLMPHAGWIEAPITSHIVSQSGRMAPVWLTKVENTGAIPGVISGNRRLLYVDRDEPERETLRCAHKILSHPAGILASALEGTRFGNPFDLKDVRTLGEAKPGLMRLAIERHIPILPIIVLGADKVMPNPEEIKRVQGTKGVVFELARHFTSKAKPRIDVCIAPIYTAHYIPITPDGQTGLSKRAKYYTQEMVRTHIIPQILAVDPNYPLGFYNDMKLEKR